jgi:hypothetical protein
MGGPERKKSLGNLCIDGRIILKWIFRYWNGEKWTALIWLWIGIGSGLL